MKRAQAKKKEESRSYEILVRYASAVVLIAGGALLSLAIFGNAGPLGAAAFQLAYAKVGIGSYLLPFLLLGGGVYAGIGKPTIPPFVALGLAVILACLLTFAGLFPSIDLGGQAGRWAGGYLSALFGISGAAVLLVAVLAISFAIVADVEAIALSLTNTWNSLFNRAKQLGDSFPITGISRDREEEGEENGDQQEAPEEAQEEREPTVTMFNDAPAGKASATGIRDFDGEYEPPSTSLLGEDKGKPGVGDIKANANIIKRTFQNFGIPVEMDEVSVGPTVTRYAIKPAEGVRLSKIVSLQNNLELALAAHPVRIEAPIPGKSLVGIEVPNTTKATVGLGGLLVAPQWNESKKQLLAALGRDITGTPHYVNIAKMPHALVAGATGSGKSVAIHAIITSLLYRNGPNQMRFIMIDPKRVELTGYNGIPHLLTPVITDPKKAILALKWAAKEMERRYNILETEGVRDLESYHNTVVEPSKKRGGDDAPEALPYIVIVIDELADIMQSYPRELEACIVRLAQMSRAIGIHLVLSTQRPSVNVITGLIKANVPTRMALQVASQIDSRTILDSGGAESLLGAGDMLYLSSDMQKPVRIQTAYISEAEVKKIVRAIKDKNAGDLTHIDMGGGATNVSDVGDTITLGGDLDGEEIDDDLYQAAKQAVEEAGRASTSYLQRKLRIGYSRAARLMDVLESKGVIGPADGSKPREVLTAVAATNPEATEESDVL